MDINSKIINIAVTEWPTKDVYWLVSTNLIRKKFRCSKDKCGFFAYKLNDLTNHEINCTNIQSIVSRQVYLGAPVDELNEIAKLIGNFDTKRNFCVFDIETVTKNELLIPISIATGKKIYFIYII